MSSRFAVALKFIFEVGWRFMTSVKLPGTDITPMAMILFGTFTFIALKFITYLFGLGSLSDASDMNQASLRAQYRQGKMPSQKVVQKNVHIPDPAEILARKYR